MRNSGIQWTDDSINPWEGCTRASDECLHCYAEAMAGRFSKAGQHYFGVAHASKHGGRWTGQLAFRPAALELPLKWTEPRVIFVGSMTDVFHERVPQHCLDHLFAMMAAAPQHRFILLTKRAERMRSYILSAPESIKDWCYARHSELRSNRPDRLDGLDLHVWNGLNASRHLNEWPLENVVLGVSAGRQQFADERIPLLLRTPAACRMVSAEPLLGPVDLSRHLHRQGLGWVIVGGESGSSPAVRPMHPQWARDLRDQCRSAGVPFFFKQWGAWAPIPLGANDEPAGQAIYLDIDGRQVMTEAGFSARPARMVRVGSKVAGDLLDGEQWHQRPALIQEVLDARTAKAVERIDG